LRRLSQKLLLRAAGLQLDMIMIMYSETSQNWPAQGPKKIGLFRGVAGFVRLLLQRIVKQGL
jgi:hypothetical protein